MGDLADYYLNRDAERQRGPETKAQRNLRLKVWTTLQNDEIRICNMSDNHLKNTRLMLIRTSMNSPFLPLIEEEMKKRCIL